MKPKGLLPRRIFPVHVCFLIVTILFPCDAFPNNGLNLIGFGAESLGMGGADIAVARDTSAMNTNPAGIAQIVRKRAEFYGGIARAIDVSHRDQLGNDTMASSPYGYQAGTGFVARIGDGPISAGIGLFGQGGAGNVYRNLATPVGTRDELSSRFMIAKITPTIAWRVSDALSIGVTLHAVYAGMEQKVLPDTSFVDNAVPSRSFFGLDLSGMRAIAPGGKIGALYRAGDRWSFGAAYTTRTRLTLKDGEGVVNMTAAGLGKVKYRDARVEGLGQPQELGLGAAFRPTPSLLLAAEANWIDWSGSMKSSTLTLSFPDNPSAPSAIAQTSALDWRDQYVLALGLAWEPSARTIFRAGYNYGRNPIPANTVNPLLPAFTEHTLTCGAGSALNGGWRIDTAIEYMLDRKVRYDNPSSPFGPGSEEEWHAIGMIVMLGRAW